MRKVFLAILLVFGPVAGPVLAQACDPGQFLMPLMAVTGSGEAAGKPDGEGGGTFSHDKVAGKQGGKKSYANHGDSPSTGDGDVAGVLLLTGGDVGCGPHPNAVYALSAVGSNDQVLPDIGIDGDGNGALAGGGSGGDNETLAVGDPKQPGPGSRLLFGDGEKQAIYSTSLNKDLAPETASELRKSGSRVMAADEEGNGGLKGPATAGAQRGEGIPMEPNGHPDAFIGRDTTAAEPSAVGGKDIAYDNTSAKLTQEDLVMRTSRSQDFEPKDAVDKTSIGSRNSFNSQGVGTNGGGDCTAVVSTAGRCAGAHQPFTQAALRNQWPDTVADRQTMFLGYCREQGYAEAVCEQGLRTIRLENPRMELGARPISSSGAIELADGRRALSTAHGLGQYIDRTWQGSSQRVYGTVLGRYDVDGQMGVLLEDINSRYQRYQAGTLDCRGYSFGVCDYVVYHHSGGWSRMDFLERGERHFFGIGEQRTGAFYAEAVARLEGRDPQEVMAQMNLEQARATLGDRPVLGRGQRALGDNVLGAEVIEARLLEDYATEQLGAGRGNAWYEWMMLMNMAQQGQTGRGATGAAAPGPTPAITAASAPQGAAGKDNAKPSGWNNDEHQNRATSVMPVGGQKQECAPAPKEILEACKRRNEALLRAATQQGMSVAGAQGGTPSTGRLLGDAQGGTLGQGQATEALPAQRGPTPGI